MRSDPTAFAKKLGDAGDDAAQVKTQVTLIQEFVNKGGIYNLAEEVIKEKNPDASAAAVKNKTDAFLKNNFSLQGVETSEAIKSAVWHVEAKDADGKDKGYLDAKQNYYTSDPKGWDGKWQIGSEPELEKLAKLESGKGAKDILDGVREMQQMKTFDLTHGVQASEHSPHPLHARLDAIKDALRNAGVGRPENSELSISFAGVKSVSGTSQYIS